MYDPLSRLTGYTQNTLSQGYNYDADGNRVSQTIGATTADATRQYAYDNRGRLIQTTTAQGIINYEINALGLRIRKQAPYANSDTLYHYDAAGHLIGEHPLGSAQYTREYIYLGDQPVMVLQ